MSEYKTNELIESAWSTFSLSELLKAATGSTDPDLPYWGRFVTCAKLVAAGIDLATVNALLR